MIDILLSNYGVFAGGLGVTLVLSATAIVLGAGLGLLVAFALRARRLPLRFFARVYRSFWRGTPILVQLLLIFYLLPALGFRVDPMTAAILALTLNSAAFQGEIYRAGLAALPRGQIEAARILGIGRWRARMVIEIPQMARLVMPALVNEAIAIVKNSSLVSVIAVTELMRRSQQIAATTFQPLDVYLIAGAIYLAVNLVLARIGVAAERRLARSGALQA
jgi:polar amino acid transport system permease protein